MKVFEINGNSISLSLFKDVTNSKELLDSMQAGTLEPEVAFLNASLIPDIFPVLAAAAHKTLVAKSRKSLATRTLHSELVYNYSGSKHITESLKRCGISDTMTYVLVARFNAPLDEINSIEKLINGKEIDLEELEGRANQARILRDISFFFYQLLPLISFLHNLLLVVTDIQCHPHNLLFFLQHYKITGPELGISSLADAISCRIAARDTV